MPKSNNKICFLCGNEGANTKDHIPPRGIFSLKSQGQLTRYKEWDGQVIILHIGKTDPDLKKDLEKLCINSSSIISKKYTLIEK
jgi:hypothetical protein